MSESGDEEQARAEILIDTDVLIEYFRGSSVVRCMIDEIRGGDVEAYFSTITETELYSGSRNGREDARIAALLSFLTRVDVDGNVAVVSGKLRYKYRARRLETPDAIISRSQSTSRGGSHAAGTRAWEPNVTNILRCTALRK